MPRHRVSGSAVSTADASTVYRILRDRPSWPSWSALGRYEFVSGTEGELDAVCAFVTRRIRSVERLVELVPDRRLSYELVEGMPMRDYRATIELVPEPSGGTLITWTSTFDHTIPGTGWWFRRLMGGFIPRMARDLAAHAAALAAGR